MVKFEIFTRQYGVLLVYNWNTLNFRQDILNTRAGYTMARLDNLQNTCKIGVTGYIISRRTMCSA